MIRRLAAAAALAALLGPAAAAAQDGSAAPGATSGRATRVGATDPAIGRLNRAGYNRRHHCTAVLVAPSEAVTARHCVETAPPGELHLLLGYDRGAFAEHHRVASVITAEGADIARLCLRARAEARPLPSAAGAPGSGPATVRGYPRTRAHAQDLRSCRLSPRSGASIVDLDCPLEQGFSGSPVRSPGPDGPVVGVASASSATASVAALLSALPEEACPTP